MDFAAAAREVLAIVRRPDKVASIEREINSAVRFFCTDSNFIRDVEEISVPLDPLEYSQSISYGLLPRFRKMQYLKVGGTATFLDEIKGHKRLSGNCLINKYYIIGSGIRINLGALASTLDAGYYQYPPELTSAAGDFWLLDLQPYMIIDRAAAMIFTNIGDDASGKHHMNLSNGAYLAFRADQKGGIDHE